MPTAEIEWMSAVELADQVRTKKLRVSDIAEVLIQRITDLNPMLNAYVHFDADQVRRDAKGLDALSDSGAPVGPLHGVPYSIKELSDVAGLPSTSGMKMFEHRIAAKDSLFVTRMKRSGGLFLGKTNAPEVGYYGGTDSHLFGPTHNPWKHGHTAGGSSGGAAAAVAAGLGPLAEGSDGAGSIRIPASLCGVVGIKPTTGVVPAPMAFLDFVYNSPLTRTVADNALMLDVVAGHDEHHTPSVRRSGASFAESLDGGVVDLRMAWSPDLGIAYVDPEVADVAHQAARALAQAGAVLTDATPRWESPSEAMWHALWVPTYAMQPLRWAAEGWDEDAPHDDIDANLLEIFAESKRLTLRDQARARLSRVEMWTAWTDFMDQFDVLLCPTLCSATFPLEQFAPSWLAGKSVREQVLDWLLTYPFNMLTNPAITVPAGFTADGRPVGLQIAAKHWDDGVVLRVARALEQVRPWAQHRPSFT